MRTTISLSDGVLRAAKRRAARSGTTLSAVVEQALRGLLAEQANAEPPFELVTFRGGGARPGVDLDRTSLLLAAEDVDRYGAHGSD